MGFNSTVWNNCVGSDYVIWSNVNLSTGYKQVFVTYTYSIGDLYLAVNIVLFVANIILLAYGERIKLYLRSMWDKAIERKNESEVLPATRPDNAGI